MGWATRCRHDEMGCVGDGDTERVGTDPARTRGRLGEAIRTISPVCWERMYQFKVRCRSRRAGVI
jgi:hypothetical protein